MLEMAIYTEIFGWSLQKKYSVRDFIVMIQCKETLAVNVNVYWNLPLESSVQVFNGRLHVEASVGGNTYCVMNSKKIKKTIT